MSPNHPSKRQKAATRGRGIGPITIQLPEIASNGDGAEDVEENQLPVLCSFPGGMPSEIDDKSEQMKNALEFQWQSNKRSKQRNLIGKDSTCLYMAGDTPATERLPEKKEGSNATKRAVVGGTKMCIGVYDKKEDKLTVHEVYGDGYVYPLTQSVYGYEGGANIEKNDTYAQRSALFEDFGSAKKRKAMKSQEANRVDVKTVVGAGRAVVDSVLKGEAMSESNKLAIEAKRDGKNDSTQRSSAADTATEQWRKDFLPTYNLKAKEAQYIYNIKEIAGGSDCWERAKRLVEKCMEAKDVASAFIDGADKEKSNRKHFKTCCIAAIERVCNAKLSKEKLKIRLICAEVARHLVKLYCTIASRARFTGFDEGRDRWFGAPNELGRFFLSTFATETIAVNGAIGYVMSKPNKDKCVLYILLLFIFIEGGEAMSIKDITPILDDMNLDMKNASNLLRMAGCAIVRNPKSGSVNARLTVPLTFPVSRQPPSRSKK